MNTELRSRVGVLSVLVVLLAYSMTSLAAVPVHRPITADALVCVVGVRLIYDVRWMRRWLILACWIVVPCAAVAFLRATIWRHAQASHPLLDLRIGSYVALGFLFPVLCFGFRAFREAVWRLTPRATSWLVALAVGFAFGLLELAARRGDGPASVGWGSFEVSVASSAACLLFASVAPDLRIREIAATLVLTGLWIAAARFQPVWAPLCAGAVATWLARSLCRDAQVRKAVAYTVFVSWAVTALVTSVISVATLW